MSPFFRVPCWIRTVAITPSPASMYDSRQVPAAGRSGSAVSSSTSATSTRVSSSSVIPCPVTALVSTNWTSPPWSSGNSCSANSCCRVRATFAFGMSTLLMATTILTSAARAWAIASWVCGITPSVAATTITAMSVTFAPRARILVNASWPGVSRNVMNRSSSTFDPSSFSSSTSRRTDHARITWVIPPASDETTSDSSP